MSHCAHYLQRIPRAQRLHYDFVMVRGEWGRKVHTMRPDLAI
jgi:hypothetical protein